MFIDKMDDIADAKDILSGMNYSARQISGQGVKLNADGPRRSALEALTLSDFDFTHIDALNGEPCNVAPEIQRQIKCDALYANYIARQEKDIAAMERDENQLIPADMDYGAISGLSNEMVAKLTKARPESIAKAGRIDGVTPAALMLILSRLKKPTTRKTGS
jgi:tRNA uridine 5-carboxymethylaminomethyl modification enzyme